MRPIRSFIAAMGLFTLIPVPPTDLDRTLATRAMRAFPVLGLLLGSVAGLVAWGIAALGGGHLLAAFAGLGVLVAATGAMHLDGIADTADGLASQAKANDALAIMKKSDIGPMGVTALVFALLVEAAALAAPGIYGVRFVVALGGMAMIGRLAAMATTGTWVPCARPGGFGSFFSGITTMPALLAETAFLLLVAGAAGSGIGGWWGVLALVGCSLAALGVGGLWRRHLVGRLGGITGDVIGSIIELTQAAFLVFLALALAWI